MVKKKNIAIITARGGSKRIPKKNILDFFGKPMIAWTIEAAQRSKIFDRIFVSTDDTEIAEISQSFGVEVPFLRDKYADAYTNGSTVTIYALEQIEKQLKEEYENVFLLLPNCPLRKSKHINMAYDNFLVKDAIFQISCFKFGWMNPWWSCRLKNNSKPDFLFPENLGKTQKRSQDLEDLYCPTGAVWIAKTNALKKTGTFYSDPLVFSSMDWKPAVDIDTYEDLEMAKAIFMMIENEKILKNPIKISKQQSL